MKKLTAVLLALVMMALPMLGLAASPDEMLQEAVDAGRPVSGKVAFELGAIPGLDAEVATIAKDLVDALGFTYAQAGDQTNFALTLSGQDALTFAFASDDVDTYVHSNLLGEKPLAFNAEDGKVLLGYLRNLIEDAGILSKSELAELDALIEQFAAQAAAMPAAPMNVEELDMTGVIAVAAELALKAETTEVTQQPKNSDAAATVTKIALTGEDVANLYKAVFEAMKDSPDLLAALNSMESLTFNGEKVTAEELMDKLPEFADAMGKMIVGDIPVEIYMDEAGEVVYAIGAVTMKGEDENGKEMTIAMDMDYARLTINNGVTHAVNVIAKDTANEGVAISVNVMETENVSSTNVGIASIKEGVAEPVITVDVNVEKEYGETESEEDMDIVVTIIDSDSKEEISFRVEVESAAKKVGEDVAYEADVDLYMMGMDEEILCVKAYQETGSAPESIMTADAIRPGQMTEEEFNSFLTNDVANNALSALMGAMQNLPTSVLTLLLGGQ